MLYIEGKRQFLIPSIGSVGIKSTAVEKPVANEFAGYVNIYTAVFVRSIPVNQWVQLRLQLAGKILEGFTAMQFFTHIPCGVGVACHGNRFINGAEVNTAA